MHPRHVSFMWDPSSNREEAYSPQGTLAAGQPLPLHTHWLEQEQPGPARTALQAAGTVSWPPPTSADCDILQCPEQRPLVSPAGLCPLLLCHPHLKFTG